MFHFSEVIRMPKINIFYVLFFLFSYLPAFSQVGNFSKKNVKYVVLRLEKKPEDPPTARIQVLDALTSTTKTLELKQVRSGKWWGGTYSLESGQGPGRDVDLSFVHPTSRVQYKLVPLVVAAKQVVVMFDTLENAEAFRSKYLKNNSANSLLDIKNSITDADRVQDELREAEKRAMALAAQERLSEEQQAAKARKALSLIGQADRLYQKEKYEDALEVYEKAIQFDPGLDKAYYKYGVSLYKTENFEKSLTMLNLAQQGVDNPLEKDYYLGLNKMRLKKFDEALDHFHYVKDENDPQLSPMAAYLAGNILYQLERYEEAKTDFEFVLDNSQQPELDNEAEARIEEIDRILQFQASQKEYLRYSIFTGVAYDTNILNQIQQGTPTDNAGYRSNYGLSLAGKFYQSHKTEFSGSLSFSDTLSMDKNLKNSRALQVADPQVLLLSLPYRTQFSVGKRSFFGALTPSSTSITMDPDQTSRRRIIQSNTLDADLSFPLFGPWMSGIRAQYNQDTSFLEVTDDDEDLSSTRTTIGTTQTRVLDARSGRSVGVDLAHSITTAKGKNNSNHRTILGLLYNAPLPWTEMQGYAKIEYMSLKYPANSNERSDSATSASFGVARTFKNGISLTGGYQYTSNSSNVESYKYNKSLVSLMVSFSGALSKK